MEWYTLIDHVISFFHNKCSFSFYASFLSFFLIGGHDQECSLRALLLIGQRMVNLIFVLEVCLKYYCF